MKKNILILITIGILFSCSNDDNESEIINLRVNHFRSTGFTLVPTLKLLVQEGNDIGTDIWTNFSTNIEGFIYEPGNIYNLLVKKETIDNPPADGSSLKYTLIEIESAEEISLETPFKIDLKINGESFITRNSGYQLLNQIEIECDNLCNELDVTLQNQDTVIGTFNRISSNEIRLIEIE